VLKQNDRPRRAFFLDPDFVRPQIRDRPAVAVGDADVQPDEVDAGAEHGRLLRRGRLREQRRGRDDQKREQTSNPERPSRRSS
jgi:hypothetical protein